MKLTPEQRAEINQKIDIIDLLDSYGVEYRKDNHGRYRIRCPFHAGDNEPSLTVFTEEIPHSWWCFGCRKGSDPLEFFRLISGESFSKIVARFIDAGTPVSVEDQVRLILQSGRNHSSKKSLKDAVGSFHLGLSIKIRSVLKKTRGSEESLRQIHSILERVDDFVEDQSWSDMVLHEVKEYFRAVEREVKKVK